MICDKTFFQSRRIATNRDALATQSRRFEKSILPLKNPRIATSRRNRDISTKTKVEIRDFYLLSDTKKHFLKDVSEKRRDVAIRYESEVGFTSSFYRLFLCSESVAIASRCVAIRCFSSRFVAIRNYLGVLWFLV
jgi:hypothetical protein